MKRRAFLKVGLFGATSAAIPIPAFATKLIERVRGPISFYVDSGKTALSDKPIWAEVIYQNLQEVMESDDPPRKGDTIILKDGTYPATELNKIEGPMISIHGCEISVKEEGLVSFGDVEMRNCKINTE